MTNTADSWFSKSYTVDTSNIDINNTLMNTIATEINTKF
jgi:hypothetical protein